MNSTPEWCAFVRTSLDLIAANTPVPAAAERARATAADLPLSELYEQVRTIRQLHANNDPSWVVGILHNLSVAIRMIRE